MKSILVVDDEPDLCEFLCFELQEKGYLVKSVSDGRQALKALENSDFEVIISDLNMPRMGGLQLLEAVKESPQKDSVVVMMTAFPEVEENELLAKGAKAVLSKPLDMNRLLQSIKA